MEEDECNASISLFIVVHRVSRYAAWWGRPKRIYIYIKTVQTKKIRQDNR